MAAADNASLYELEQLSSLYTDSMHDFVVFVKKQEENSAIRQSGMKFIDMCKLTSSMANIET